jgi:hypothetical protein
MAQAVLLYAHAGDCNTCKKLASRWPAIKSKIEELKLVDIVEMKVPSKDSPVPQKDEKGNVYPRDVASFIQFYPIFILISKDSWKAGDKLDGIVFNAVYDSGNWKSKVSRQYEEIPMWITENIDRFNKKAAGGTGTIPTVRTAATVLDYNNTSQHSSGFVGDVPCSLFLGRRGQT